MKRKYLFTFIYDNKDCLFRDIISAKSPIEYFPSHKKYRNRFASFIESCVLSYQVNRKINFPFQTVFYNLDSYKYKGDVEYYLIIPNSSIAKFTVKYLNSFKSKHKNIKLIALLVDSMHGNSIQMNLVRDKLKADIWDHVLTYDKYDAEEFGYSWTGYTYYSAHDAAPVSKCKSDIFCVSSPKGRDGIYAELYKIFQSHNVDCNFRLFTHSKDKYLAGTDLEYMHDFMKYDDVVSEIKASNCILEILQPNQKMQTIRYFEAIVYNKKLLTNNARIYELPYYDSRYMKVYSKTEDIDFDWIKKKEEIQYDYHGDFSPNELVRVLSKLK